MRVNVYIIADDDQMMLHNAHYQARIKNHSCISVIAPIKGNHPRILPFFLLPHCSNSRKSIIDR